MNEQVKEVDFWKENKYHPNPLFYQVSNSSVLNEKGKIFNLNNKLGVDMASDFIQCYLHAENGATFYSRGKEIYQLGCFLININLSHNLYQIEDTSENQSHAHEDKSGQGKN